MTLWHIEIQRFFAFLRHRGFRYPLMVFGHEIQIQHYGFPPPAQNDNQAPSRSR
jgi:hypothetical protein